MLWCPVLIPSQRAKAFDYGTQIEFARQHGADLVWHYQMVLLPVRFAVEFCFSCLEQYGVFAYQCQLNHAWKVTSDGAKLTENRREP